MAVNRITRVNQLLRREIGEVLFHVVKNANINLAVVSITQVSVSRDLRNAHVGVSILGDERERARVLNVLRGCRADIQSRVNKDLYLRYTPRLTFELDTSVEKGDQMLALLARIEDQGDPSSEASPPQESTPDETPAE